VQISLFDQGSVQVSGLRLFGLQLTSGPALMVCAAVCLALASLAVVALRRSRFGRRLIALRDSEAAYATLGGNLLVAKVGVFALSAGIAGLGGALYAMQQHSVTAGQFNLVAGLPIFLVAVIGGLASVGDGLFTGTAFVGPLNAMVAVAPWSLNLAAILPGLAGIGLGRNPDGITPALRRDWEPVARHRIALTVAAVAVTLLWVLRLIHVINGWVLFGGALAALLALRAYAAARPVPAAGTDAATAAATAAGPDVPVEWWGVRRPWGADDEEVMARGIAGG
jgi:branched-chain amino acid transport system permease protein